MSVGKHQADSVTLQREQHYYAVAVAVTVTHCTIAHVECARYAIIECRHVFKPFRWHSFNSMRWCLRWLGMSQWFSCLIRQEHTNCRHKDAMMRLNSFVIKPQNNDNDVRSIQKEENEMRKGWWCQFRYTHTIAWMELFGWRLLLIPLWPILCSCTWK